MTLFTFLGALCLKQTPLEKKKVKKIGPTLLNKMESFNKTKTMRLNTKCYGRKQTTLSAVLIFALF